MEQIATEIRIMGIDYGEKRIGIALSDPLLTFAYPFVTLKNDASFLSNLSKIIIEKKIIRVILGLPSERFKSSKELSQKVFKLKSEIETKNKIEVILWDEEYSSVIAKEKVMESVTKKSKRKQKDLLDRHSAAVILQEYLDKK
ncbi:MAG: Holliday junction resolvase RuvX [Ignavibacteriaceae bacterium]|nr:Holliday junction resolvase RuvX [Ignavibacteriaceae bacterium]